MIPVFAISLVLLGLSGLLLDSHRRSWRAARESTGLPAHGLRFARSQYRRRMQASGMIGAIGATIAVYPIVPREPGPMALYMAVLVSACGWIMLLALLDVWATREHYRRLRHEQLTAEMRLVVELRAAGKSGDTEA